MRFLLFFLFLLATPLRAFDCSGTDLWPMMDSADRATLEARAGQYPYRTGLFWRATRGDTTLTLFGTYHFFHEATERQIEALLPHARAADFSYFEMNFEDTQTFEQRSKTDMSLMFITSGPTIPEMMEEADWQRLRRRMSTLGIPSFLAAKFKPIFLSMMIGSSPCLMRKQTQGSKGIDHRLAADLHAEERDTRSIENMSTIVTLLDSFSRDEQIAMIKLSLDLPQDPEDLQETLLRLYLRGEIALLWEYGRLLSLRYGGPSAAADFERFETSLLINRNRAWVEKIEAQTPGKSVFIAVGAGHLPGKHGVLNLLAERGYAIAPLSLNE